jgi:hypothetical protein
MINVMISDIKDELVLYFDTKEKSVNAYTLATALVSLADAAKEANKIINPGYEIEVIVTALEEGSFKAVVKTVFKEVKNLFSAESLRNIILSIIATMIYEKYFACQPNIQIINNEDSVVISSNNEKVVIPKNVYEATQLVEKTKNVNAKVDRLAGSSKKDERVMGFGIMKPGIDKPEVILSKNDIEKAFVETVIEESDTRENIEITTVEILRAILEETDRLWEFVWYGNKISAPVIDDQFYRKFREHRITIAPGDKFDVRLKIIQKKDKGSGIFINSKYEVIEVLKHIPRTIDPELK